MEPRTGLFWSEVGKMTTLDGQQCFKHLHKLMAGLLSIPVSNADSERGFSMLRKVHTDQRSKSTLVALMAMKFNTSRVMDSHWGPEESVTGRHANKS